jgi:hypothetical protein
MAFAERRISLQRAYAPRRKLEENVAFIGFAKTMRSQRIKTSFRIARTALIRRDNNLVRAVNESYVKLRRLACLSFDVLFTSCMWRALRHETTITIYVVAVTRDPARLHDIHVLARRG